MTLHAAGKNMSDDAKCPYVVGRTTLHCSLTPFTLTDEEREAMEAAATLAGLEAAATYNENNEKEKKFWSDRKRTLRKLLERLK
jgi:GAF domain-containing protein